MSQFIADGLIPAATNVIISSVGWLQETLLGPFAAAVAIVAVASVGFLMLTGRIDVRRAARVVFGCFILFGASTIAGGLMSAVRGGVGGEIELANTAPPPQLPPPPATAPATAVQPYDPYAGAALPPR